MGLVRGYRGRCLIISGACLVTSIAGFWMSPVLIEAWVNIVVAMAVLCGLLLLVSVIRQFPITLRLIISLELCLALGVMLGRMPLHHTVGQGAFVLTIVGYFVLAGLALRRQLQFGAHQRWLGILALVIALGSMVLATLLEGVWGMLWQVAALGCLGLLLYGVLERLLHPPAQAQPFLDGAALVLLGVGIWTNWALVLTYTFSA
ncbi:MAG: hypothetical protein D6712_14870 [Chloroflexi bacterium]|nr:MAG: hypothetical protein D6712_14870 [Chloroflexota bacterium]